MWLRRLFLWKHKGKYSFPATHCLLANFCPGLKSPWDHPFSYVLGENKRLTEEKSVARDSLCTACKYAFLFYQQRQWCPSLMAATILQAPTKCDGLFSLSCGAYAARLLIKGLGFIVFCNEIGKWDFINPFFGLLWHGTCLYKKRIIIYIENAAFKTKQVPNCWKICCMCEL